MTSDGFVLTDAEFFGEAADLDRNLLNLLVAAETTSDERTEFERRYRERVDDWRPVLSGPQPATDRLTRPERSLFAARSPLALSVGFVVESGRRERSIGHQLRPSVTGLASIPTRGLEAYGDTDASLLTAGCLADPDALAAFDDRAAQAMSVLRPYFR